MISITAVIIGKPDKKALLLPLLKELVTETRKEKACIRYDLHAAENTFILWEEWQNQTGLDIHNEKPYLSNLIDRSEELTIDIQVYKTHLLL